VVVISLGPFRCWSSNEYVFIQRIIYI